MLAPNEGMSKQHLDELALSSIPAELFEAFQTNDAETAAAYGRNIDFLKKNNAEIK